MKVKELKDAIYRYNNKDLIKFLQCNFVQKGNIELNKYRNNLDTLKKIDNDTRNTLIARMTQLEEVYEVFNKIRFILPIAILLLSFYSSLFESLLKDSLLPFLYIIRLCAAVIMLFYFTQEIGIHIGKRSTAIYIKQLVIDTHAPQETINEYKVY